MFCWPGSTARSSLTELVTALKWEYSEIYWPS